MKTVISIEIDTDRLETWTDQYLAQLWHVTQANPAPMEDRAAGALTEYVGREIIRRFLANTPPDLWNHQGRHAEFCELLNLRNSLGASATAMAATGEDPQP